MEGIQTSDLLASQGATPKKNKKQGQKTEALEATGISGFTEALPGNDDSFGFGFGKDGSGVLTVQEGISQGGSWTDGFSGDPVIGGLADVVASLAASQSTKPFVQALVYNTSKYAMLEVAQLVFDGLSGAASGNASGLSIAQLKEMVKKVLEKLDTILDEPSKSCGDFIDKALQAIEHKCPKDAKGYFEKAVENAVKGFHYVTGQGKPEAMVSIMRLMIFAEMMLATFDEEDGIFLGLENPKVNQKRVFAIIRESSNIILDIR